MMRLKTLSIAPAPPPPPLLRLLPLTYSLRISGVSIPFPGDGHGGLEGLPVRQYGQSYDVGYATEAVRQGYESVCWDFGGVELHG